MNVMRSRALLAAVVLSCALVSGGWFVEGGLLQTLGGHGSSATDGAQLFDEVFTRIHRDYVDTLADSTLFTNAVGGLVEELNDPHSSYLSPKLYARLSEQTSGHYAGVGAQIDVRDGWITIVAPLPDGPAVQAGILSGDRIIKVNDQEMRGVTVDEAQKALRGQPGSVVRVMIERPGVTTPIKFALTRREIHVASVQHATMLRDGVGYVALTIFSEESAADLRHAIDSLRSAGMHTLILDLRGDPGGLLDQGVAVSDLFLDPGQRIVSMRGRTPDQNLTYDDRAPQTWPGMPVAVLVDSNTASAAEIVSGALQDHDRAVLLGTTTYGKGSAQSLFKLGNGGVVKLTTALWFTPSGRSINRPRPNPDQPLPDTTQASRPAYRTDSGRRVLGGGGITPDVQLAAAPTPSSDTAFEGALGKQIPQFRDALTDYALSLKANHAVSSPDFTVTPAMRADLFRQMRSHGVTVDSATYAAAAPLIDRLIGYEVAHYLFGDSAEFARRLHDDTAIASALTFVQGATSEKELLEKASKK